MKWQDDLDILPFHKKKYIRTNFICQAIGPADRKTPRMKRIMGLVEMLQMFPVV